MFVPVRSEASPLYLSMPFLFKSTTAEGVHRRFENAGLSLKGAWKVQGAVIRTGTIPARIPEISDKTLARVRGESEIPALDLVDREVSPVDGFVRYGFRGKGPGEFEAVRIPLLHRPEDRKYVVCVSSQVGCALGCTFCETGRDGLVRNLDAWEIVDQVIRIRDDSEYPVRGVVFMGMGEPMLNLDAVLRAAEVLCEPCGCAISAKAITISTAGIVPGIRRLAELGVQYRLIVSLSAANSEKRVALMPVERAHPLPELMAVLREYHGRTRRRMVLAWTMISGVNVSNDDAAELAALVEGLPIKLDLIDVNDVSGVYGPPGPDELAAFRSSLRTRLRMPVVRRYSGGIDIRAACGMLSRESNAAVSRGRCDWGES
jgi:23S rRNA (adenine2503-C2)-methyltransferase